MKPAIPGLTNRAYAALRQDYGSDRAVWHAVSAYKRRDGLRLLCLRHGINPDLE